MKIDEVALEGVNLVEASAGTGKTHTLSSLYLRLLLEREMGPESILVMTYTQAATAELKTRIRQRLIEARQLFQGGESSDPLLFALDQKLADKARVIRQLDLALASFDRAAIFTIHGFCQRVLTEFAFESGQSFHTELVPDQAIRLQQIADDFWRREVSRLSQPFLEALQAVVATPDELLNRLKPALGKPYLEVRSASWPDGIEAIESQAQEKLSELRSGWSSERDNIQKLLSDNQVLNGRVYQSKWVTGWCNSMDLWLNGNIYVAPFEKVERFTPQVIQAAVKAGKSPPQHPFFQALENYLPIAEACIAAFKQALVAWQGAMYEYMMAELPKRQAESAEWSYDDLLLQLQIALQKDHSGELGGKLRKRYRAALVDEFQDTDPIQYEILDRIYHATDQPVFMVGDPKQAIYSFRGADIFTYLHARENGVAKLHSLDTNWRSTPEMVSAINSLFSFSPHPFFDSRITFHTTRSADRQMDQLTERNKKAAALQIWRLPDEPTQSIEDLRQRVADTTAAEVASLLTSASSRRIKIGQREVIGSDIAILVRTHKQAAQIATALGTKGISSVRSSQQSVYLSVEAEALERVLIALLEPHRERAMRAALATLLFGWRGAEIDNLNFDEKAQSQISKRFFEYHQLWRSSGFIVMFRGLMSEFEVENRFLDYQDGERRLTNLYHLVELIQQQDSAQRPGMEGLVTWYRYQRQSSSQDEERLLRLESDGDLVRIDTMHHSKGLEYGIVFCPYLWDESVEMNSNKPFLFHDPAANDAPTLELGPERLSKNFNYRQYEVQAENLRLAYVALTRSRFRCYLPWGLNKSSRQSALCWLLHSGGLHQPSDELSDWQAAAKALEQKQDEQRLAMLSESAQGTIEIIPMPEFEVEGQMPLALPPELNPARQLSIRIPKHLQVSSFSSLVAGLPEDLPDHDGLVSAGSSAAEFEEKMDVHGFPRGSGPGSCLHAILEELDFNQPDLHAVEGLVGEKLQLFGIDSCWSAVVVEWMLALLQTPLSGEGIRLGDVSNKQRLNEMSFHFPIKAFNTNQIYALADKCSFSDTPGLLEGLGVVNSASVDGFIKGYIDLVFEVQGRYYLADYKSNWLGADYPAYHKQALAQAMVGHHYSLQYVLYTLALHRYLRLRIPDYSYDRHFGGVFYLFLRGMHPDGDHQLGILQERPPAEFIEALDNLIGGQL
ncbi:MAG: exodeoxyribonuclease V subunit beta [Candidatus Thiodiazotropha sp. 6PLUC1]